MVEGQPLEAKRQLSGESLEREVITLLEQREKMKAVMLYQEETGAGLQQAIEAVNRISSKRGISTPGCFGAILLMMLGLMMIVFARGILQA